MDINSLRKKTGTGKFSSGTYLPGVGSDQTLNEPSNTSWVVVPMGSKSSCCAWALYNIISESLSSLGTIKHPEPLSYGMDAGMWSLFRAPFTYKNVSLFITNLGRGLRSTKGDWVVGLPR